MTEVFQPSNCKHLYQLSQDVLCALICPLSRACAILRNGEVMPVAGGGETAPVALLWEASVTIYIFYFVFTQFKAFLNSPFSVSTYFQR